MLSRRRLLQALAALGPAMPGRAARAREGTNVRREPLVLSRFDAGADYIMPGARWRGFSDRVMGGVSDATFGRATVAGRACIRLTGRVTTDSGGGFVQMALDLGGAGGMLDGAAWRGVELLVHGNDEDYNVHVRTADCGWYDESYRATFRAAPDWARVRLAWSDFAPNGVSMPLDAARLQRIALLGWMRKFTADIALAEIALYP